MRKPRVSKKAKGIAQETTMEKPQELNEKARWKTMMETKECDPKS